MSSFRVFHCWDGRRRLWAGGVAYGYHSRTACPVLGPLVGEWPSLRVHEQRTWHKDGYRQAREVRSRRDAPTPRLFSMKVWLKASPPVTQFQFTSKRRYMRPRPWRFRNVEEAKTLPRMPGRPLSANMRKTRSYIATISALHRRACR